MIKLMDHQKQVLEETKSFNKCAYYLDMGLGKTYVGSEKAVSLGKNILVICQKSKIDDWINHFINNYIYGSNACNVYNLTNEKEFEMMFKYIEYNHCINVFIINYELAWRRPKLSKLSDFTLMLDESSLIQNETTKQAKFILNKLNPANVILLSGTPVNGKYELLWSQCNLLGWSISKKLFYRQYVAYSVDSEGYPIITGYKNVERLKAKLKAYGAVFMKTEEVLDLPAQTFIDIKCCETKEYQYFKKHSIVEVEGKQLVGDTTLTNLLYQRMLCSQFNKEKLDAFEDILNSTNDRIIVFYNFNEELSKLREIGLKNGRPLSFCNGSERDLGNYEKCENALILVQYQSGAYGLNLQKANKIVYFSPPLSSELFEQSKKRIHRIGQEQPCFYYQLKSGIDYRIYDVLAMRKDYTEELFKNERRV
jgi:SNF2 family DNA or RNA helicase